jgi:hypothetical protein
MEKKQKQRAMEATKLKTSHSNLDLNLSEQCSNNSHRDTHEARQRTRRRNTNNSARARGGTITTRLALVGAGGRVVEGERRVRRRLQVEVVCRPALARADGLELFLDRQHRPKVVGHEKRVCGLTEKGGLCLRAVSRV